MKKISNGAKYDTETAQQIGDWFTDVGGMTFCSETLYRTKAGKFFMHVQGGPMSRYARRVNSNTWGYGEEIIPLSVLSAQTWAEEHVKPEMYATIFGEPEEAAEGKETINLSIRADIKRKLERIKQETGKSISVIVEEAFERA